MTKEEIVLQLIRENKTYNDLIKDSGLTIKELYKVLNNIKSKGYLIEKKYYYDGEIKYSINNNLDVPIDNILLTSKSDNDLEFMIISDLHFGSLYETPKLINSIYEYCTNKNIHIILNGGDFIDGEVNLVNTKLSPIKQIDHALKVYPTSPEIINYLVLGNHDYSMLVNYGMDISSVIKERREDMVPLGYGEGIVKVKNDQIVLQHPLLYKASNNGSYSKTIIIRGHGHEPKIILDTSNLVIYAPSLSNLNFNKCHFPGAIHLKVKMRCGLIEYVYIEELLVFNNKLCTSNELNIYFGHNKIFKMKDEILNEEEYPKVLSKVIK